MKFVNLIIAVILLSMLISCENCEKRVLYTNIYSINIESSDIQEHCFLFAEGEAFGTEDFIRYFFSPSRTHFLKPSLSHDRALDYCDLESGEVIYTISTGTEDEYFLSLCFSDSGENITFAENTVYLTTIYGDNLIEICDGTYPSFSPNEEKIVFVDNQGYLSIYDLTTNQISQLTYEDGIKFPIYHPDGNKIYFSSYNGIHYFLLDANIAINISNGNPANCTTKISISDSGENKAFSSNNNIYAINVQDKVIDLETSGKFPHISHGGNKIIYIKARTDSIFIMNFDGSEKTFLCETLIEADNACFSENDQRVFFINHEWGMTDDYCY